MLSESDTFIHLSGKPLLKMGLPQLRAGLNKRMGCLYFNLNHVMSAFCLSLDHQRSLLITSAPAAAAYNI
jgi:hypothetical protein